MQTALLPKSVTNYMDKIQRQFLWGSTAEKRKLHNVKWEKVCNHKNEGGLGIRKMRPFNKALLAKQTWRVILTEQSLPITILATKYSKGLSGLRTCTFRPGDSSTWKGICKQLDVIQKGVGKNVFNGRGTSFWYDKWMGKFSLSEFTTKPLDESLKDKTVTDNWINNQ